MRFHKTTIRWISPIFALCFLLMGTGAHSFSNEPRGQNLSLEARIDEYVRPYLDAGGFSGAILAAKDGRVLLSKGYGMANYELGSPNTPKTKFHIASLSKTFTAAAVLLLEEEGRLSVSDPVAKFIPDYPRGELITIHHLLTHTSGIPNVNDFPDYERLSRFPHGLEEIVGWFKGKPLEFAPGERYGYSNSNYNLLALIIEKVSGASYGDFLKRRIFDPLEMRDTGHDASPARLLENRASGYAPSGGNGIANAPFLDWSIKTGNSSLYSTVEDLYKWDRALAREKVLKRAALEKLFTEHINGIGYGWFVAKRLGRRAVYFNGRSPGFTSSIDRFIDDDACLIILSNNYAPVPQLIIKDLAAILFGEPYLKPQPLKPVRLMKDNIEPLLGRYRFGKDFYRPEAVVTVETDGQNLVMAWNAEYRTPLMSLSPSEFLDRSFWARIIFERDEQGRVTRFVWRDTADYPAAKIR